MPHVGSLFPDQGLNPRSLHWKSRILTTGPPRKSLYFFSFYLFIIIIILIYFWLRWVFIAAHGLSLVVVSGG